MPSREPDASVILNQLNRLSLDLRRFSPSLTLEAPNQTDLPAEVISARAELMSFLSNDAWIDSLRAISRQELEIELFKVIRLAISGRLQPFLSQVDLPHPIYNLLAGFEQNSLGPWGTYPISSQVESPTAWNILGMDVRTPIGIPASSLTANAEWVRYFALRGFNILTFKSVRSSEFAPHAFPHWLFVDDSSSNPVVTSEQMISQVPQVRADTSTFPKSFENFSMVNSFGVPSPSPVIWQREVEQSLKVLNHGQLLIVSVMGSSEEGLRQQLIDDYVTVSRLANETGVSAVELNLSCPNTVSKSSSGMQLPICNDVELTKDIVAAVRADLPAQTKLLAKIGFLDDEPLGELVLGISNSIDGISAINTVSATVQSKTGKTPFVGTEADPARERRTAGLSGSAIRGLAQSIVKRLDGLRTDNNLKFQIFGMGGVMNVDDAREFYDAGADVVQSATGACVNVDLAADVSADAQQQLSARSQEFRTKDSRLATIGRFLRTGELSA